MKESNTNEKSPNEESDSQVVSKTEDPKEKKIKNLISLVILLSGLFVASLFVDIGQLVKGGGFSFGRLPGVDVFESGGKTWVAYSEPILEVAVLNDDNCEACSTDEALIGLKRILPTILTKKVAQDSPAGEKLIADFNIKTIPAYIFSKKIANTDFYQEAASIFENKGDQYMLNTAQIGLPVGKYLELPEITDADIKIGPDDARVKVIEFSDFQCPFCKAFHPTVKEVLSVYGDKIQYVYKQFPLTSIHPQAENAALASECANEQGKFLAYADKLFASQSDWGSSKGTQKFKTYALQLGLKRVDFNQCLDSKKYQSQIDLGLEQGKNFGISGTPGTFINSQFKNGAVDSETVKSIIDLEMNK